MRARDRHLITIAAIVVLFVTMGAIVALSISLISVWMTVAYDPNPPPPQGTPAAYSWQLGSPIRQIEFHPSGKTLAVLQEGGELTLRAIPTGNLQSKLELSKSLELIPMEIPPTRIPSTPGATSVSTETVGETTPARTPDATELGRPFHEIWGAMTFSADGTLLAASSQQLRETCFDSFFYPEDSRTCPRGVMGTWRVAASLWNVDPSTGSLASITPVRVLTATSFLGKYETTGPESVPTSFAFSPSGDTLAMGNADGSVFLWDVKSGKLLKTLPGTPDWVGLYYDIRAIKWSTDGGTLYTGDYDEVMREWEVSTGEVKRTNSHSDEHSRGHSTYVMSYRFSPNDRLEATASWAYEIAIFNRANGDLIRTIGDRGTPVKQSTIWSLAFSPDNKLIASGGGMKDCLDTSGCGSDDPSVRVWRVEDGMQLALYSGHTDSVMALDWSPDGRTVTSGSDDGSIRLWDVSALH